MTSCQNVYEQWCPNGNLFASRELAEQWADQQSLPGRVLSLDEASDLATEAWNDVIRPTSFVVDRRSQIATMTKPT
jgi:hypothetical protein